MNCTAQIGKAVRKVPNPELAWVSDAIAGLINVKRSTYKALLLPPNPMAPWTWARSRNQGVGLPSEVSVDGTDGPSHKTSRVKYTPDLEGSDPRETFFSCIKTGGRYREEGSEDICRIVGAVT